MTDTRLVSSEETIVRSTCPSCGTVEVPATQVTVLVSTTACDPLYRYSCPSCDGLVEKPTSVKAVPLLRGAGATIILVPAEVAERAGSYAPALDHEDLREFGRALADADELAQLAATPPLRRPTVS